MKQKLLSILALLLMTATGAWADTTVTWTADDMKNPGIKIDFEYGYAYNNTINGITATASGEGSGDWRRNTIFNMSGSTTITFTSSVGNIKSIAITAANMMMSSTPSGWMTDYSTLSWSGVASSTVSLTLSGESEIYNISEIVFTIAAPATYAVTANSAGDAYWSTFYTEAGNYQAPEGTQVFAVNLEGTTLTMTEISDRIVKSGEGVVLKKTTTGSITMTKTETAPAGDFSGNRLTGTMAAINTSSANDYYVLGNGSQGVGFYKLSSTGTIGANKAYLTYSATAREFFPIEGNVTGIEMPKAATTNNDAEVYAVQGRRVANPTKGLYIVNGKKVFINK